MLRRAEATAAAAGRLTAVLTSAETCRIETECPTAQQRLVGVKLASQKEVPNREGWGWQEGEGGLLNWLIHESGGRERVFESQECDQATRRKYRREHVGNVCMYAVANGKRSTFRGEHLIEPRHETNFLSVGMLPLANVLADDQSPPVRFTPLNGRHAINHEGWQLQQLSISEISPHGGFPAPGTAVCTARNPSGALS